MEAAQEQPIEDPQLPDARVKGSLPALKEYVSRKDVVTRLEFVFDGDKQKAKKCLLCLYEMVETAKDPSTLLKCDPRSIVTAAVQAARLGLIVDGRGHAWVVPYNNKDKGVVEATMQIGWKGYVSRLKQHLDECDVLVELVYEGDVFAIKSSGLRQTYEFIPCNPFSSGKRACMGGFCYVQWRDKDGEVRSVVGRMSVEEIKSAQKMAKTQNVWEAWWGEMAKKTVIKRTCKLQFESITEDLDRVDNRLYRDPEDSTARPAPMSGIDAVRDRLKRESEVRDATFTDVSINNPIENEVSYDKNIPPPSDRPVDAEEDKPSDKKTRKKSRGVQEGNEEAAVVSQGGTTEWNWDHVREHFTSFEGAEKYNGDMFNAQGEVTMTVPAPFFPDGIQMGTSVLVNYLHNTPHPERVSVVNANGGFINFLIKEGCLSSLKEIHAATINAENGDG